MIVVYGGSFNPPTKAHIEIANKVLNFNYINKLIFLPVGNFYNKKDLIDIKHRINMIEGIFYEHKNVVISDLEEKYNKPLKTIESLKLIKEEYPNEEIAFIMGADNLIDIKSWYMYEDMIKEFKFIVFNRDDSNILDFINNDKVLNRYKDKFIIEDIDIEYGISSTVVRELIKQEKKYNDLLDLNTYKYIKENKLYIQSN